MLFFSSDLSEVHQANQEFLQAGIQSEIRTRPLPNGWPLMPPTPSYGFETTRIATGRSCYASNSVSLRQATRQPVPDRTLENCGSMLVGSGN